MATPQPNGNSDQFFIDRVRRSLKDRYAYFTDPFTADGAVLGSIGAGQKPIRLQRGVIRPGGLILTAPGPALATGFSSWMPIFDTVLPQITQIPPNITDGGAGGTFAAGNYNASYAFVDVSGNVGPPSFLTFAVALGANHKLTTPALSAALVPGNAVSANWYVVGSNGSSVGFLGNVAAVAGAIPTATFVNPPTNGIIPMTVVTETGELIFPNLPGAGAVSVTYQSSRWSDQAILDALHEGMYQLFPDLWQEADDTTSIQLTPTIFEYTLPAIFSDPRVLLMAVEVSPPTGFLIYESTGAWEQIGQTTLKIHRSWAPGSTCRIRYNSPYQQLSDVEAGAMHLPIYYACYRLLLDLDSSRSNASNIQTLTGEGGTKPGDGTNVAMQWYQAYQTGKAQLSRDAARREDVPQRMAETLGGAWKPW